MTAVLEPGTVQDNRLGGVFEVYGKGELVGMLADLALFASTDPTVADCLRMIRLHRSGGYLYGWATNRYVLAHARVKLTDDSTLPENRAFYVDAAEAKEFGRTFRKALFVQATVSGGKLTVSDFAVSSSVPVLDNVQYPAVETVGKPELPEGWTPTAFDPKYLEPLVKVAKRRKEYLAFATHNERKPAHVRVGEDFRAWAMPVRLPDDAGEWLHPTV